MAETKKAVAVTDEQKTLLLEKKLMEFSHKLSVPKTEHNDFGNYMYRTAEAILNACKPLESEFNARVFTDATLMECGGKLFLDTTATFMDLDTGATRQTHSYTLHDLSKPKMSAEQVSGSCNTYGRKYALQNLLSIDNSELDPDVADNTTATGYNGEARQQEVQQAAPEQGQQAQPAPTQVVASEEDVNAATRDLIALKVDMTQVLKMYQVKSMRDLTVEQMEHLKKQIVVTRKKRAEQSKNVTTVPLNA